MPSRNRRIGSIRHELLIKSKEAALSAIKLFNDPLITFKSESFIVLMMIAWIYLLHSYYRQKGVEYRYFKEGKQRRQFERTKKGAYKYWELERCLSDDHSPIDHDTANNLRFLIGLRHEIEHQMTLSLDAFLSGRYQACALNYNTYLKQLFGIRQGLDKNLSFSLQFLELSTEQISEIQSAPNIPKKISAYITSFDAGLNHEEYNSKRFSYRFSLRKN